MKTIKRCLLLCVMGALCAEGAEGQPEFTLTKPSQTEGISIAPVLTVRNVRTSCFIQNQKRSICSTLDSRRASVDAEQPDDVIAFDSLNYPLGILQQAGGGSGCNDEWQTSRANVPLIEAFPGACESEIVLPDVSISGHEDRDNSLRRELESPLTK